MNSKEVDYIIVGQGLAGTCLALQLLFLNKKILVVDNLQQHTATKVAAGLFNPFTGKRTAKTWMADTLFSYLHEFYPRAEEFTGRKFFYPMPLYRPFGSVEEQNEWMGKSSDENFTKYIEAIHATPVSPGQIKNKLGGLLLKQCGYVNSISFCESVYQVLKSKDALLEEDFDESQINLLLDSVSYKAWSAKKIIYCSGEHVNKSKYFSWVPIKPLKGETLTIKTREIVSTIYNKGVYVVPGIWKVGSTYNLNDLSKGITEEARIELVEKLEQLVSFPYEISDQQWGIRPTTHDRRPILGPHPEFEHLVIFNGLGTKGISLAPYFSEVLVSWMENGRPLNNEVAVNRYKSVYWNSA